MLVLGFLVLIAFAVVGLGALLGNYWLSSLLVGALLALFGGILVLSGRRGIREDHLAPVQTAASLREDRAWAAREMREMKQDLTGRTGE